MKVFEIAKQLFDPLFDYLVDVGEGIKALYFFYAMALPLLSFAGFFSNHGMSIDWAYFGMAGHSLRWLGEFSLAMSKGKRVNDKVTGGKSLVLFFIQGTIGAMLALFTTGWAGDKVSNILTGAIGSEVIIPEYFIAIALGFMAPSLLKYALKQVDKLNTK